MKTAFVIRDIPDLDHLTPIIYKFLLNDEKLVILNYEINLNLENDFRIKFLQKKFGKIIIINVYSFINDNFIYRILSKTFSIKNFEINLKNLKHERKYNFNFLKKLIIAFLKKIFFKKNSYFENFFFNKKWLKKIFKILQIKSVVLDDSSYFVYQKAQNLVNVCHEEKIKTFLFPHTCFIFDAKEDYVYIKKNLKKLKNFPNLITNSNFRKNKLVDIGVDKNKILVCGSGRFSPEWLEIYKQITNCQSMKNLNIKVIYFEGIYNDQLLEKELIKYLSKLDYIDLTVKAHPRGIFSNKQIIDRKEKKLLLDHSTPSTKLINENDIIIGTFSSILVDAFIMKKTVIYPKFLINEDEIEILYSGKDFTFDCSNHKEVSDVILKYKNKQLNLNDKNLDSFMKDFVYGNKNKDTILNDYVNMFKVV